MVVFEVTSGMKKSIRLSEVQWAHISSKHPEMLEQGERMQMTLRQPDLVYHSPGEDNFQYLKFFTQTPVTKKYLLIIVKHLNGEGFVITAFFVSRIRTGGKVLVHGKENLNKLR